ncbi:MAG: hypothetical protein A3B37_02720 [Candidatus Sungbacteria bacterium RIFCSPLOWO2_01_FULL_59_16]|uniref:Rod shape-determining protein MreD n=1 Tax=Candidatus Sungbacteria bacterium RIFCSPLOWO2_01_FULL_59_16 TaxID=1802280 RepID=A0A1G2LAX5_9BACT|nr:MAG: hypothetical protein A3B37_02720 [Candidatus Sungbacteria bacterium RIFCSPLOWO2_01_FULL_59_16]
MTFLTWFLGYAVLLLFEVAVLPNFFGSSVPAIALSFAIVAISWQKFPSGFWFAGLAGFLRDAFATPAAADHTIHLVMIFLAMHLFFVLIPWDEPLRRLGGIAAGLLAVPAAWIPAAGVGRIVFGLDPPPLAWADLASSVAIREAAFAAIWFLILAWVAVRLASVRRAAAIGRLTP